MPTTNFSAGTVVGSVWLNEVDAIVWDIFNGANTVATSGSVFVSNGTYYEQQDGATLRDSLGLAIGTDVQAWDSDLDTLAALSPVNNGIIVGDTDPKWVVETGATARTSLGLGTGDDVTFNDISGADITGTGAVQGDTVTGTNGVTSNGNAVREVGRETIWLPAHSWIPAETNGPAAGQTETTTNSINFKTLDFDQTTSEIAWFPIEMPKNWDEGTIVAKFQWTATSGSGTVTWGIQGVSISNDGVIDTAPGTAQTVTDTLTATGDLHTTSETSAVTLAGTPAEGDVTFLKIYRDIADTLSADAKLIGVHIYITTNAANDD